MESPSTEATAGTPLQPPKRPRCLLTWVIISTGILFPAAIGFYNFFAFAITGAEDFAHDVFFRVALAFAILRTVLQWTACIVTAVFKYKTRETDVFVRFSQISVALKGVIWFEFVPILAVSLLSIRCGPETTIIVDQKYECYRQLSSAMTVQLTGILTWVWTAWVLPFRVRADE